MAETERESYVYVRLKRPEGYEDVHPELLVADANIHSAFEPEIVASQPEEAVAQRLLPAEQWVEEAERLAEAFEIATGDFFTGRGTREQKKAAWKALVSHLRQPVAGSAEKSVQLGKGGRE